MLNPTPSSIETFAQRYPTSPYAHLFPSQSSKEAADELTYADVDRQVTVIFNVVVSIVACGAAIFIAARHWNPPARVAVSMGGAAIVGIAEVVIYLGYLRRVGEAKAKERKNVEKKEIADTWVIEPKMNGTMKTSGIGNGGSLRFRTRGVEAKEP